MSTAPAFAPVPVRARRDGWTPARQVAFIAALCKTECVAAAARAVGMSWQSAYRLRTRPGAAGFAAAWDAVTAFTAAAATDRTFDGRLAVSLLTLRLPDRFGLSG